MEMITHCGYGVAMKNALPQVQAAANATTLSNEEDGVAVYLNTLLSGILLQTQKNYAGLHINR